MQINGLRIKKKNAYMNTILHARCERFHIPYDLFEIIFNSSRYNNNNIIIIIIII